ncbi:hypothetical protein SAMN05428965_1661 [Geodermatophilus sp. DSM 45219]|nr:hypothetical protein SAMN05428965_1661 [Geodermatophilus sp. DSM 45219]
MRPGVRHLDDLAVVSVESLAFAWWSLEQPINADRSAWRRLPYEDKRPYVTRARFVLNHSQDMPEA